ncbi:MAG: flagellar hook-length control protein FliK [Methylovulum sp.]|nr:flagellar hook-length control protein FliK [Methylovulum sp.]
MNIEGTNLSTLSGTHTIRTDSSPASAKTAVAHEFTDTFKSQMKLSKPAHHRPEQRHANETQHKPQTDNGGQARAPDNDDVAAITDKKLESADKTHTDTDLESTLAALADVLKPVMQNADTAINPQGSSALMLLNGQLVANRPAEAASPGLSEDDISLVDSLPSKAAFLESTTDAKETTLPSLDNAGLSDKTSLSDPSALTEPENTLPGINPQQRLIDNKTEFTAIAKPLNHPGWNKELGEQIVWMYNKTIPSAEITLNPEHLGPMTVRIDVNQDQASILFTTPHAAVKEALEASLPKLREMLNTQQLNLADVNVSQHSSSQQHSPDRNLANSSEQWQQRGDGGIDDTGQTENAQTVVVKGLLSLYA